MNREHISGSYLRTRILTNFERSYKQRRLSDSHSIKQTTTEQNIVLDVKDTGNIAVNFEQLNISTNICIQLTSWTLFSIFMNAYVMFLLNPDALRPGICWDSSYKMDPTPFTLFLEWTHAAFTFVCEPYRWAVFHLLTCHLCTDTLVPELHYAVSINKRHDLVDLILFHDTYFYLKPFLVDSLNVTII